MNNFWKNWTWRKTTFSSGDGFTELSFFSNNYNHCENTLKEACKRLELKDFGIKPATGGGYTGTLTIQQSNNGVMI
tara:strand:+ start:213 stop:440 length:228 start_codon:yes stop_codon:yes gene_type:complete